MEITGLVQADPIIDMQKYTYPLVCIYFLPEITSINGMYKSPIPNTSKVVSNKVVSNI